MHCRKTICCFGTKSSWYWESAILALPNFAKDTNLDQLIAIKEYFPSQLAGPDQTVVQVHGADQQADYD